MKPYCRPACDVSYRLVASRVAIALSSFLRIGALVLLLPSLGQIGGTKAAQQNQILEEAEGPKFDPVPVEIPSRVDGPRRPIRTMDLLTLRDLRGLQISPDGGSIAFVVSQAVYATNSYRTGLFVVSTAQGSKPISLGSAGPPRWDQSGQYTTEPPTWPPNRRYIAYVLKTG